MGVYNATVESRVIKTNKPTRSPQKQTSITCKKAQTKKSQSVGKYQGFVIFTAQYKTWMWPQGF